MMYTRLSNSFVGLVRWMNNSSFEEYLEEHKTLIYSQIGVSMMPLLRQGKDLLEVRRKGPERAQVGDVVLYRRPPDQYVLHRVVKVRPEDYVILGDNTIHREMGIRDEDILGIMTGYVRGGRHHQVTELGYRVYTWVIMHTIPLRIGIKKIIMGIRKSAGRAYRSVRAWLHRHGN